MLSFAARHTRDLALLGTLQSWPVAHVDAAGRVSPLVMVGPVAVAPAAQRGGIGRLLMAAMIDAAEAGAADGTLMMIGDPEYYGHFWGFSADATAQWAVPGPVERHRLLARAVAGLQPPNVAGLLGPRANVTA